jgi:hypothetical protein
LILVTAGTNAAAALELVAFNLLRRSSARFGPEGRAFLLHVGVGYAALAIGLGLVVPVVWLWPLRRRARAAAPERLRARRWRRIRTLPAIFLLKGALLWAPIPILMPTLGYALTHQLLPARIATFVLAALLAATLALAGTYTFAWKMALHVLVPRVARDAAAPEIADEIAAFDHAGRTRTSSRLFAAVLVLSASLLVVIGGEDFEPGSFRKFAALLTGLLALGQLGYMGVHRRQRADEAALARLAARDEAASP